MKIIPTTLLWMRLLNRRLIRRPLFLVILLLVPILTLSLGGASDSAEVGVMNVALAWDAKDSDARALAEALGEESGVVRFHLCSNAQEARRMVAEGRADLAWIFRPGLEEGMQKSLHGRFPVVTVVERESSALLALSREKLFGALYPRLSRLLFRDYLSRKQGEPLSEAELEPYYRYVHTNDSLVRFTTVSGTDRVFGLDYLRAPLRGLLSILILLSGIAGSAILADDREQGRMVWCDRGTLARLRAVYTVTPMLDTALAVWLALTISGATPDALWEALLLLLLVLSGGGMAALVGALCRRSRVIAPVALLLTVAMLALCPIFLGLPGTAHTGGLFPAHYYLHAAWEHIYALRLLLYGAVCWGLLGITELLRSA